MCGICGYLRLDGAPLDRDEAAGVLRAMCDALAHRGPDDEGLFIGGPVALGHRRLSIIDLESGHQPLGNEDGSVQLVANGEIYEFAALRDRLEGHGHRFATRTDAETIVHAWEQWGSGCLGRLHGMFAWALWDARRRTLFLARDRVGKKPLYHTVAGPYLVFASELKSLVRHPAVGRALSPEALRAYLAYEAIPAPLSIYQGVHKLEPGFCAVVRVDPPEGDGSDGGVDGGVDGGRAARVSASAPPPAPGARRTELGRIVVSDQAADHARRRWAVEASGRGGSEVATAVAGKDVRQAGRLPTRCYWDYDFRRSSREDIGLEEAERRIETLLCEAVGRRLISDVPLGVFLSGGIDSSSIVALMREHKSARDIHTFSIAFAEKSFDESTYARRVAKRFGTTHREERLHPRRMLEILPDIARILDEPLADPSFVPTFLLSEFTRRHVTVALGGDAGDELFAGYDPFVADAPGRWLGWLPGPVLRAMRSAADLLPVSTRNVSFDFKVKKFLEGLPFPERHRHFAWLGSFEPPLHRALLSPRAFAPAAERDPYRRIDDYLEQLGDRRGPDPLHAIVYLYLKIYMQDDILVKVDRATMAHALEARAPYLDTAFVEFVCRLPAAWKLRRRGTSVTTKWILKRALERRLPHDILYRPKKGFGIPVAAWLRGPLRREVEAALDPARLRRQGVFRPSYVQRLLREHFAGTQNHGKRLWTLLSFQRWWDEHGEGSWGA